MSEQWRPIDGTKGLYEVSDQGRIRRALTAPVCQGSRPGKILKAVKQSAGYRRVGLSFGERYANGRPKFHWEYIHRLVVRAFLPKQTEKPCVNHLNGDKTDNRLENLVWCTYQENNQHALDTGLHKVKADYLQEIATLRQENQDLHNLLTATLCRVIVQKARDYLREGVI